MRKAGKYPMCPDQESIMQRSSEFGTTRHMPLYAKSQCGRKKRIKSGKEISMAKAAAAQSKGGGGMMAYARAICPTGVL
jgi:hypothetical protein